jgi:hypothetical protein
LCPRRRGQRLAYVWPVGYVLYLAIFAALGYCVYSGRAPRLGLLAGLLLGAAGVLAASDGMTRAWREYAFTRDGRSTPGVVVAQISPTNARKPSVSRRGQLARDLKTLTIEGSRIHDVLDRLILTGSPRAWIIEYRYECERPRECHGRDIVPEELWRRLHPGQTVNVRRPNGDAEWSRLDDNPQSGQAIADLTIAAALLVAAAAVSGQFKRRRRRYLTVPAVITAVDPARAGDEPTWRITFAYLDSKGDAHEATDEVIVPRWKPGDDGFAVFPPGQPELATFRPPDAA